MHRSLSHMNVCLNLGTFIYFHVSGEFTQSPCSVLCLFIFNWKMTVVENILEIKKRIKMNVIMLFHLY